MDAAAMVPALVLLPLGAALFLALTPLREVAARRAATAAAAGLLVLASLLSLPGGGAAAAGPGPGVAWLPATGTALSLAVDGLNRYALLALAAVVLLAVIVEGRLETRASRARLALSLTCAGGLALVLTSRDLMVAAFGHGLAGLALAGVLGLGTGADSERAGRRFARWAATGSLLLTVAAGLCSAGSGTTRIDELAVGGTSHGPIAAALGAAALAMQIPLVPFHTWLVPVCSAGALSGRILVAGAWCLAGVFGLLRFGPALFPAEALAASPWPVLWAGSSAAWTAILALVQERPGLSRRVALATASGGGLMAAGALGSGVLQVAGAAALAAGSALPRASLLMLAAWIEERGAGGARTACLWLVLSLTVAAVPGGGGLPGWLALLVGSLAAHAGIGWLLLLSTGALAMALLGPVVDLARRPASSPWAPMRLVLTLVILTSAITALRPEPLLSGARPVVERMLAPAWNPPDRSGNTPRPGPAGEIRP